ncbi:hypothetical protein [Burkholderia pseudomallei]|uniref:hypothetical protein n=1 Tax=Burkholderia pseudomallei TaxID=28450 RepID=UPI00351C47CD
MQRVRIEVVARDHVGDERVDLRVVRVALRNDFFFECLPLLYARLRLRLRLRLRVRVRVRVRVRQAPPFIAAALRQPSRLARPAGL